MRKKPSILAIMSLVSLLPITASASDSDTAYKFDGLSFNAALGHLSGEAHEYVYEANKNKKISQLDWRIDSALIAKGELNYDVKPWLSINGKGWATLAKGSGFMDDYDWLNNYQSNWTHWSYHDNTHLNNANGIDVSLQTWLLNKPSYKLGLLGGYEKTSFSLRAKGGCFIYDNARQIGCFEDNEPGIGYRQKFKTPYVGLAGKYAINNFELNLLMKLSNWVKSEDRDEHYSRDLTFKEWGTKAKYHSLTLNAGYYFTKNAKVFAEASYANYGNTKADTEIKNNSSGRRSYIPNSAGLDNKNYIFAIGVQYIM
ncbi:plasminogen activator protein [Legionella busanensis]|uniref:Plasminogen activator protein n=1 Tax=Legionella busanensis TaxID=190655 RepID=A0A378JFY5_9GAMM|nr:omptin family outer membrane protease [Legionella busanensis]STX50186.1 plasminogen activator protein [Legionella busanensis]